MRTGICLLLFGLLCAGLHAQQATKPQSGKQLAQNTLTAQQIAEGWIQLFDGTTDYGWAPRGEAKWTVAEGALRSEPGKAGALCTTADFGEGILHFECARASAGGAGIAVRVPAGSAVDPKYAAVYRFANENKRPAGRGGTVWTTYEFVITDKAATLHIDKKESDTFRFGAPGHGGIALLTDNKEPVLFRNIRFQPRGLKSVFNGKDLTGWMSPEGNKSVFSVTKEGWLNVKNGRGDLQTIEQWGDFVLQIEVLSNGEHLNSGIFFRAEPGKFQQGYEDQIRNQWEGENRMKPVDYGTGAVYNRQPVRKVVSTDHEWFTMTLIAHGTHIASWVNGVLVCDFTDTRPPDQENARKGARTKAGVISIQGHDPTTDLNFRNIRIAELPAAGK